MKKITGKNIAKAICTAQIGQCLLVKSILINELCYIFRKYNHNFDEIKFRQKCQPQSILVK